VQQAGTAFRGGHKGTRASALCMRLDVPAGWLDEVADHLVDGGVLVSVHDDEDLLMPARPPEQIAMADVAAAVAGSDDAFLQRVRLPAATEAVLVAAESAAHAKLAAIAF
jgi:DNA-binding IscR family transcriptional regulator